MRKSKDEEKQRANMLAENQDIDRALQSVIVGSAEWHALLSRKLNNIAKIRRTEKAKN